MKKGKKSEIGTMLIDVVPFLIKELIGWIKRKRKRKDKDV